MRHREAHDLILLVGRIQRGLDGLERALVEEGGRVLGPPPAGAHGDALRADDADAPRRVGKQHHRAALGRRVADVHHLLVLEDVDVAHRALLARLVDVDLFGHRVAVVALLAQAEVDRVARREAQRGHAPRARLARRARLVVVCVLAARQARVQRVAARLVPRVAAALGRARIWLRHGVARKHLEAQVERCVLPVEQERVADAVELEHVERLPLSAVLDVIEDHPAAVRRGARLRAGVRRRPRAAELGALDAAGAVRARHDRGLLHSLGRVDQVADRVDDGQHRAQELRRARHLILLDALQARNGHQLRGRARDNADLQREVLQAACAEDELERAWDGLDEPEAREGGDAVDGRDGAARLRAVHARHLDERRDDLRERRVDGKDLDRRVTDERRVLREALRRHTHADVATGAAREAHGDRALLGVLLGQPVAAAVLHLHLHVGQVHGGRRRNRVRVERLQPARRGRVDEGGLLRVERVRLVLGLGDGQAAAGDDERGRQLGRQAGDDVDHDLVVRQQLVREAHAVRRAQHLRLHEPDADSRDVAIRAHAGQRDGGLHLRLVVVVVVQLGLDRQGQHAVPVRRDVLVVIERDAEGGRVIEQREQVVVAAVLDVQHLVRDGRHGRRAHRERRVVHHMQAARRARQHVHVQPRRRGVHTPRVAGRLPAHARRGGDEVRPDGRRLEHRVGDGQQPRAHEVGRVAVRHPRRHVRADAADVQQDLARRVLLAALVAADIERLQREQAGLAVRVDVHDAAGDADEVLCLVQAGQVLQERRQRRHRRLREHERARVADVDEHGHRRARERVDGHLAHVRAVGQLHELLNLRAHDAELVRDGVERVVEVHAVEGDLALDDVEHHDRVLREVAVAVLLRRDAARGVEAPLARGRRRAAPLRRRVRQLAQRHLAALHLRAGLHRRARSVHDVHLDLVQRHARVAHLLLQRRALVAERHGRAHVREDEAGARVVVPAVERDLERARADVRHGRAGAAQAVAVDEDGGAQHDVSDLALDGLHSAVRRRRARDAAAGHGDAERRTGGARVGRDPEDDGLDVCLELGGRVRVRRAVQRHLDVVRVRRQRRRARVLDEERRHVLRAESLNHLVRRRLDDAHAELVSLAEAAAAHAHTAATLGRLRLRAHARDAHEQDVQEAGEVARVRGLGAVIGVVRLVVRARVRVARGLGARVVIERHAGGYDEVAVGSHGRRREVLGGLAARARRDDGRQLPHVGRRRLRRQHPARHREHARVEVGVDVGDRRQHQEDASLVEHHGGAVHLLAAHGERGGDAVRLGRVDRAAVEHDGRHVREEVVRVGGVLLRARDDDERLLRDGLAQHRADGARGVRRRHRVKLHQLAARHADEQDAAALLVARAPRADDGKVTGAGQRARVRERVVEVQHLHVAQARQRDAHDGRGRRVAALPAVREDVARQVVAGARVAPGEVRVLAVVGDARRLEGAAEGVGQERRVDVARIRKVVVRVGRAVHEAGDAGGVVRVVDREGAPRRGVVEQHIAVRGVEVVDSEGEARAEAPDVAPVVRVEGEGRLALEDGYALRLRLEAVSRVGRLEQALGAARLAAVARARAVGAVLVVEAVVAERQARLVPRARAVVAVPHLAPRRRRREAVGGVVLAAARQARAHARLDPALAHGGAVTRVLPLVVEARTQRARLRDVAARDDELLANAQRARVLRLRQRRRRARADAVDELEARLGHVGVVELGARAALHLRVVRRVVLQALGRAEGLALDRERLHGRVPVVDGVVLGAGGVGRVHGAHVLLVRRHELAAPELRARGLLALVPGALALQAGGLHARKLVAAVLQAVVPELRLEGRVVAARAARRVQPLVRVRVDRLAEPQRGALVQLPRVVGRRLAAAVVAALHARVARLVRAALALAIVLEALELQALLLHARELGAAGHRGTERREHPKVGVALQVARLAAVAGRRLRVGAARAVLGRAARVVAVRAAALAVAVVLLAHVLEARVLDARVRLHALEAAIGGAAEARHALVRRDAAGPGDARVRRHGEQQRGVRVDEPQPLVDAAEATVDRVERRHDGERGRRLVVQVDHGVQGDAVAVNADGEAAGAHLERRVDDVHVAPQRRQREQLDLAAAGVDSDE
mmetsp:Transcript_23238/g.80956  ORF Transcript_23238/g.80956 Transcript_23238/m.80956 type:complete len:2105 (+) Transcript_23238:2468-8782(+)